MSDHRSHSRKAALLTSVMLTLFGAPALAQGVTPPEPPSPAPVAPRADAPVDQQSTSASSESSGQASPRAKASSVELGEIVVTAQKRTQNLRDVPTSITALSAETLEARGVSQLTDLSALTPSLTVTQGTDALQSSINIRGVGTSAFSIAIEPSVAVIVDDVPLLQQAQAFSGLSDIEQIEVLRGPQGTLFGKNASAGAINIVTKGPTATLAGDAVVTATTDQQYRVDAAVSGPLGVANAGFRLNGFYENYNDYVYDVTTRNTINGNESWAFEGGSTSMLEVEQRSS